MRILMYLGVLGDIYVIILTGISTVHGIAMSLACLEGKAESDREKLLRVQWNTHGYKA